MKHIPEPIRDSLASAWELAPSSLKFLGGGQDWSDGTLFSAPRGGAELVIKILDFPPEDSEAPSRAEDRIRLVKALGDQGCPIVTPLAAEDGRLYLTHSTSDRLFLAYAYEKVPGRSFRRDDEAIQTGALFEAFGELMGKLHQASAHIDQKGPALHGWQAEMDFFRSWCDEPVVALAWDHLREALSVLPETPGEYGFVHNDLHLANLLFDPQAPGPLKMTVIDFDVANNHWFMADCAIALYSLACLGAGGLETASGPPVGWNERAWSSFWTGYRRKRVPSPAEMSRLNLFLHYRRCLLFMPLQTETAHDPAWRSRWIARIVEEDRRLFP